jgi:hypothetical protein
MANTPNGLPYPVGTDKVVDGDNAIRNLATTVDTKVLTRGADGSVPVVAGGLFTISNNKLFIRGGYLMGTVDWARTSGTLGHADQICTITAPLIYELGQSCSAGPSPFYYFLVPLTAAGVVVAQSPPAGRTSGTLRILAPVSFG